MPIIFSVFQFNFFQLLLVLLCVCANVCVMFMCLYLTKPSFCKNHPTYCNTEGLRFFQERLLLKWTLTGLASCSCPGLNGHRNTDNRVISNYNRCPWFEVFLKFQQRLQYGHGKKKSWKRWRQKAGGVEWVVCLGHLQMVSVSSVPESSAWQAQQDKDGLILSSTVTGHWMTYLVLLGSDRPPTILSHYSEIA